MRFEYHSKARDVGQALSVIGISSLAFYIVGAEIYKKHRKRLES